MKPKLVNSCFNSGELGIQQFQCSICNKFFIEDYNSSEYKFCPFCSCSLILKDGK